MRLADFDVDAFLRDYWQKKPLLIRNPWAEWGNPLEPDELAGLACEDHVESRLITDQAGHFALEHGPLPADRFDSLAPGSDAASWTLLVQAVDHHVPEVADLLDAFRFIPNWRVDDVMVSYAVRGGGVGAHFDQYDVFLVQGLGTRRWQIGGMCDASSPRVANEDLHLLADFQPSEEWVLEPGDMLYVPPGFSHNGTAQSDDCMTYSIGFRAPSREELLEGYAAHVLDRLKEDDRYTDSNLRADGKAALNPGEISEAALSHLHEMVAGELSNRDDFARWFAGFATQPKNAAIDWQPETPKTAQQLAQDLRSGRAILRNPASRFAFIRAANDAVVLSVDGDCFDVDAECSAFAEALCAAPRIEDAAGFADEPGIVSLMEELHARGSIAVEH